MNADDRAIILDILGDVTVDALVTVRHAEEMADEITAALHRRGLTITVDNVDNVELPLTHTA